MDELSNAERHVRLANMSASCATVDRLLADAEFIDYGDRNKATGLRSMHKWRSAAQRDVSIAVGDRVYHIYQYIDGSMSMHCKGSTYFDCYVQTVPPELREQAIEALEATSRRLADYLQSLVEGK